MERETHTSEARTAAEMPVPERSYRAIFASSLMMGSQQVVLQLIGLAQAKVVAVQVGKAGVGLFGLYATLLVLGQSVFGLGLAGSGVREIAAQSGAGRLSPPAKTIRVLQTSAVGLAVAGALVLVVLRRFLHAWFLGGEGSAAAVGFIAVALVATQWCNVLMAIMQGLRRLRELVLARLIGALLSAAAVVALTLALGVRGIAPAYAASGLCLLVGAGWIYRRLRLPAGRVSVPEWRAIGGRLATLGIGFMAPPFFSSASAYGIRAAIARTLGLESVGLFQSAWMLSTVYAEVVLQAMGTDFLPRLSAAARDRHALRRLANEQAEAGLAILVPGLLLCLVAAPLLLRVLYAKEFAGGAATARWMLLATVVRAAGWSLAYLPLALGRPVVVTVTEGVFHALLAGLALVGVRRFGLEGVGVAFLLTAVVYTAVQWVVAHRMVGFVWSRSVRWLMGWLLSGCVAVFLLLERSAWRGAPWLAGAVALLLSAGCAAWAWRLLGGGMTVGAATGALSACVRSRFRGILKRDA